MDRPHHNSTRTRKLVRWRSARLELLERRNLLAGLTDQLLSDENVAFDVAAETFIAETFVADGPVYVFDDAGPTAGLLSISPIGDEAITDDGLTASPTDAVSSGDFTVEDGTDEDGTDEDGTDEDGTDEDGTDEDGTDEDGTVEDGTVEDGTVEDGTVEDGTVEDGTVEDGTDEDGTDEDGTDEDGTDEDGTDEDGNIVPSILDAGGRVDSDGWFYLNGLPVTNGDPASQVYIGAGTWGPLANQEVGVGVPDGSSEKFEYAPENAPDEGGVFPSGPNAGFEPPNVDIGPSVSETPVELDNEPAFDSIRKTPVDAANPGGDSEADAVPAAVVRNERLGRQMLGIGGTAIQQGSPRLSADGGIRRDDQVLSTGRAHRYFRRAGESQSGSRTMVSRSRLADAARDQYFAVIVADSSVAASHAAVNSSSVTTTGEATRDQVQVKRRANGILGSDRLHDRAIAENWSQWVSETELSIPQGGGRIAGMLPMLAPMLTWFAAAEPVAPAAAATDIRLEAEPSAGEASTETPAPESSTSNALPGDRRAIAGSLFVVSTLAVAGATVPAHGKDEEHAASA